MRCSICENYAVVNPYDHAVIALSGHHPHCKEYVPELFMVRAVDLIENLAKGIEVWAADEDGVHDAVWIAYQEAKSVTSLPPMPEEGK